MTRMEVRPYRGAPTLFVDGTPSFAAIYLTVRNFHDLTTPWEPDPHFDEFRDVGFHFYSIHMPVSFDHAYDPATGEFRSESFARMDDLRHYARKDPQARFLLRVGVEPRGDDSTWLRQHPDECEVLEPRAKGIYRTPSFASKVWLADAGRFLRALIGYLYEQGLHEHILGYLVCGGDSAEWVKVGPMEDWAGDYSPAMQQAFREWLRAKYGGEVHALRAAWGDPSVSFEQDLVPTPEEQAATDLFLFRDPRRRRRAIDHFQCLAHVVASDITTLCGAAKQACKREHLAGAFYGYLQEIVWNNGFFGQRLADADVAHTAGARSGHTGLREVLASPDVDFLSSPYSYGFRGVGGEGGFMAPEESVRLAGKLWISEEDMRTHLWPQHSCYGQTHNAHETAEVLKRQLANILTHNAGAWWCDWGKREGGAYADPEVMCVFRRAMEVGQHQFALPDRSSVAEIAVVFDAESPLYRSTANNWDVPNWRNRAWGIARIGAPVDVLLLSDLLEGRARDYKLYYFKDAFHLSASERETLKALLRRDGKAALWLYAPGFVEDDLDVAHCEDLMGLALRMTERQWGVSIYVSNFDHPLTRALPASTFWGTDMRLGPLFTVDDTHATTLGTAVINQGRCEPGYVLREYPTWASLYMCAPNPPPMVLREIARYVGVHLYSESEDVLYADRYHVALHTVRAGAKRVYLPYRADVWEVYSGRFVGRNCTAFEDVMEAGSTHLYYYGPGPRP